MAVMTRDDDTEVRRARRSWSAEYKRDILREIDDAKRAGEPGAVGEICRREGLYSSLISEWRRQRDEGALDGLRDKPAGRRGKDPLRVELDRLREENDRLAERLATAEELIDAQGKAWALLSELSRKSAEPKSKRS